MKDGLSYIVVLYGPLLDKVSSLNSEWVRVSRVREGEGGDFEKNLSYLL